jgi:Flp pilus assembly protein TadD
MTLTRFIPKISLVAAMTVLVLSSCMESEEERLAREKVTQDSIRSASVRKEEKSLEDSMVNVAKSPQQEKDDSTSAPLDGSGNPGVK